MDFRLGFDASFGDETQVVVVGSTAPERPQPRPVAAELYGGVAATLDALRGGARGGRDRGEWTRRLRAIEDDKRAEEQPELDDERAPLHPMRVYRELNAFLDRDAIVIGDGGDFVT